MGDLARTLANQEKNSLLRRELIEKSKRYYDKVLKLVSHTPSVSRAKVYGGLGSLTQTESKLGEAIRFYHKALVTDPYKKHKSLSAISLARTFLALGRLDEAERWSERAARYSKSPLFIISDLQLEIAMKQKKMNLVRSLLKKLRRSFDRMKSSRRTNFVITPQTQNMLRQKFAAYEKMLARR